MRGRVSIRRRMLAAFVLLALGLGLTQGLVGVLSYDRLGEYLMGWHARPVMEALIEAEKRAWEAEDRGRGKLYYGEDLAAAMHWRFLVGKQIFPEWRDLPDGLHFFDRKEAFVLLVRRDGVQYALSGDIGVFQSLKRRLGGLLLLCAMAGLAVAVLLAVVLSRRLTGPLSRLTQAVESRFFENPPPVPAGAQSRSEGARAGDPALASLPPIPASLTQLEDEVGVLARALAAREKALRRFVLRESFFTGDVSHELRTPLTVMQGGLEILELRLAALPGGAELTPVVERLLRTTARMTATVRTLLLLARHPGEIEFRALDCSLLLRGLLLEMEREGLLRMAPEQSPEDDARSCFHNFFAHGPALLHAHIEGNVRTRGQRELGLIVFKNLLDNARQYTENGRVFVTLAAGELIVRNGGRISGDLDIFARGVSGRSKAEGAGSGLGLSLAQRACERLGWRLERLPADNAAPLGETSFCVTFPPLSEGENA